MWSRENLEKIKFNSDWDDPVSAKAPLSESQKASIEELEKIVSATFYCQSKEEQEEVTTHGSNVFEFLDACSKIEKEVLNESTIPHNSLVEQLNSWLSETDDVLHAVDKSLAALNTLKEQHSSVSESTGALHASCRALAAQEARLGELNEEITSRLEPLTNLEALTERLCNPGLSLAGGAFYMALSRLDQSIEYIDQHPEYKEAAQFRAQAHFALSRAVTVLLNAVRESFEQATKQVLALPTQADLSGGAALALCVGRFQATSSRARQVIKQIEPRLAVAPEYERLLGECRDLYVQQRKLLLSNSVSAAIQELVVRHKADHCSLLRAASTFCLHVCLDEFHLYYHFFASGSEQLTEYMDGLCSSLYDILRPIIIHVNHLETLAELCTILRFEMLEEQISINADALDSLRRTLLQLLQDVQERLVFRAHIHFQSDILQYNPSPGDLAYPEKLQMMESIAVSVNEESRIRRISVTSRASVAESELSHATTRTQGSPADLHGMWYPPVRRVLATLSRLYRCVDRGIFQGLSQEALASCVNSVSKAASMIATRSSKVDACLFEMKHLLILREQVAPFQVDFTVQETSLDFTKVKSAVYTLLQNRNQLFSFSNNSLLEFLLEGTPTVKQLTVDSRKEVDRQLKTVCETFIEHATHLLTPRLSPLMEKINLAKADPTNLRKQPWFTSELISEAVRDTQRQIKAKLPSVLRSLQLYLACQDTELLLYRHIKMRVMAAFHGLQQSVNAAGFNEEELTLMAIPTPEQLQLLLSTASQPPQQSPPLPPQQQAAPS